MVGENTGTDCMSMAEIGIKLRARREELGFTLAYVQAETKIRQKYLEAVENGDDAIIPGEVYAKGFIRAYANFLGFDGLDLMRKYRLWKEQQGLSQPAEDEVLPAAPAPPPGRAPGSRRASPPRRVRRTRAPRTALVFLLVVALGLALGYYGFRQIPLLGELFAPGVATNGQQGRSTGENTPATGPQTGSGERPGGGSDDAADQGSGNAGKPAGETSGVGSPVGEEGRGAALTVTRTPGSGNEIVYTVAGAQALEVTLKAVERCWLRVWQDKDDIAGMQREQPRPAPDFEGELALGGVKSWNAAERLVILAGNPEGIVVTVGDQPQGTLREPGPRVLVFQLQP